MDSRKLGGAKIAAGRIGIPLEDYLQKVNSGLKWCFRCKSFVSRDFFANSATKSDGKHSDCKNCDKVTIRHRYKLIKLEGKKPRNSSVRLGRDGDKKQARSRVSGAVKLGKLPHAGTLPCTDCGHIGGDRVHEYDHYLGYAAINHLEVQVVCSPCHHKRERQRKQQ